jgi:hypothetical protein
MKAQFVVSIADDGAVSVDKVKAVSLPLDTSGKTDFLIVGNYGATDAMIALANIIYKLFNS